MKVKSRKTYILSNKLIIIALVLEIIPAFVFVGYNMIVSLTWFVFIGAQLLTLILNPKWRIDASSKIIVDKENKVKLELKNKQIKENFTEREKPYIKLRFIIIVLVILGVIYGSILLIKYFIPKGNKRDTSVLQVEIIAPKIYIRDNDRDVIGFVKEGEYYTVLSTSFNGWDNNCAYYFKIKNADGITGKICGKYAGENYVKVLLSENSSVDPTKRLLRVVNEYINVRKKAIETADKIGIVFEGEEYEILDKDGYWYKIMTNQGKEGWIKGQQGGDKYIEEIKN